VSLLYLAHPVSAPTVEGIRANLARAKRWLWWLRRTRPGDTVMAPWIVDVEIALDNAGNETDGRAAGLRDCEVIAARCDGIVLVGGKLTSGMARERSVVLVETCGEGVIDLLELGEEPPVVG
jgi:hypothetical protein